MGKNVYTQKTSKAGIEQLVESFSKNIEKIKRSPDAYEATVEDNYIKPLFQYLNWNIHNQGLSHDRQEFVVQYRLRRSGKKPDYLLRVPEPDGRRMRHVLFMEAKHPKYDLMNDIRWIRQSYLYANSTLCKTERPERRVPLSLLTDFEEFRLFDCRDRLPLEKNDLTEYNRRAVPPFSDWTFEKYLSDFDTLWDRFERGQVEKGSLDDFRVGDADLKASRRTPDLEFLTVLKEWRKALAQDMYRNDHTLSEDVLTAASQLMVNRLVFLKMLADKELEADYLTGIIDSVSTAGKKTEEISFYEECQSIFDDLHRTFNGSVFEHRKELDSVRVSNKTLNGILDSMRPEKALYSLDAMPVRVVGTMYEEFLGDVIRKVGRGVTTEPKPEVRKAGGVYYTPEYIVDYIVDHTVGELLADCKTPQDVERLKICDPACGSGSFLIAVYDRLLNWHTDYYTKQVETLRNAGKSLSAVQKKLEDDVHISDRNWSKGDYGLVLTIKRKAAILKNSVFGVDIDEQAAEVTRFSLSMKAVEDYDDQSELFHEVDLFKTTVLPDLTNNIKSGNSLIGKDYFDQLKLEVKDEFFERKSIKPFDYSEAFPAVFEAGNGFDAVVGNPPYISATGLNDAAKKYFGRVYDSAAGRLDTYGIFTEKGIQLCKNSGLLSFIVPNKFITNIQFKALRAVILDNCQIDSISFVEEAAFDRAAVNSVIFVFRKSTNNRFSNVVQIRSTKGAGTWDRHGIVQKLFMEDQDKRFLISYDSSVRDIANKVGAGSTRFDSLFDVRDGIIAGRIKDLLFVDHECSQSCKPLIFGDDMGRYKLGWLGRFVDYQPEKMKREEKKRIQRGGLGLRMRTPDIFETKKIITRKTSDRIIAALDEVGYYFEQTVHGSILKDKSYDERYFLGILNSKLYLYYYQNAMHQSGTIFPQVRIGYLKSLPVHVIDFGNIEEKSLHDELASLVGRLLNLSNELKGCRTDLDTRTLQGMIDRTDSEIDRLVYRLYGLNEEEIRIVEKAV